MADGLLLSRRERVRTFWLKFLVGVGPPLVLAAVVLSLGGGSVGIAAAVFGVLLGFVVATSARTLRGAVVAGLVVAIVIFAFQVVVAWLVTHPIERGT